MTIASALTALNTDIQNARAAITNKGGTVTSGGGSSQLATDIATIPSGGGDTVTATNNTGSAISDGDKVWINKSGNDYELIEPKTSQNPMFGFFTMGTLSFDKINKSITGFSDSQYCFVEQTMDFSHPWELNMSFQTGSDISTNQFLYAGNGTTQANMNSSGLVIWLNGGTVLQADFMYNNGSSVIGHMSVIPASAMSTYTTYYIKIGWTGTEYYGKYSLDGTVWVENTERITSQTQISQDVNTIRLGQMGWITTMFFRGKIFMDKTYLTSGDSIQWQMYSDGANNLESDMLTGTASENIAVSGTGDVYIGNVIEPTISSLSITPSTSAQTFNSSSVDGYKPVSVSAVTSAIDSNITAGNIKSGVSILGVTGNYTGTTPTLITKTITQNGTYNASYDDADGYSSVTVSVSGGSSNEVGYIFTNYYSQTLSGASLVLLEGNVNSYNSSLVVPTKVVGYINRNGGYDYNTYYWMIEKNTNYSLFYLNMSSYIKIKTVNISTDTYDKGTYVISGGGEN